MFWKGEFPQKSTWSEENSLVLVKMSSISWLPPPSYFSGYLVVYTKLDTKWPLLYYNVIDLSSFLFFSLNPRNWNLKKGGTHIHTTLIFNLKYVLIRSAKPNLSLEYIIDTYTNKQNHLISQSQIRIYFMFFFVLKLNNDKIYTPYDLPDLTFTISQIFFTPPITITCSLGSMKK